MFIGSILAFVDEMLLARTVELYVPAASERTSAVKLEWQPAKNLIDWPACGCSQVRNHAETITMNSFELLFWRRCLSSSWAATGCRPGSRRGPLDDAVDQGRIAGECAARISAAADGARRSGRISTACGNMRFGRRPKSKPDEVGRRNPGAVRGRIGAERREEAGASRTSGCGIGATFESPELADRRAAAAALRRGRLEVHGVGQRQAGRRAHGRLRSVHVRYHAMRCNADGKPNELVVAVTDPTDTGTSRAASKCSSRTASCTPR